jgi:hypothetical protein
MACSFGPLGESGLTGPVEPAWIVCGGAVNELGGPVGAQSVREAGPRR